MFLNYILLTIRRTFNTTQIIDTPREANFCEQKRTARKDRTTF